MEITHKSLNRFLMLNLPAAFLCGVRLKAINNEGSEVGVTYRWINKNPFRSMYFAVQSMAAELSTGSLLLKKVKESGQPVSTLVTDYKGSFSKKAVGHIRFLCTDGSVCDAALAKAIATGEGQTFVMNSVGINELGEQVSAYQFEWSIKLRNKT